LWGREWRAGIAKALEEAKGGGNEGCFGEFEKKGKKSEISV
jgi:hypothetical protein